MHALTESVWEVITWKSKTPYDAASDQYTRIFMPKLFIISSLVMGFSYFNDKLNCMVSARLHELKEFVQETCWIQGFYIYQEMHTRLNESSYYGIPEYNGYDGVTKAGQLCSMLDRAGGKNIACNEMTKRYFLHYQWLPFFVCSMAILYFFPYLIFRAGNSDIISLVDLVLTGNMKDVDKLVNNYFNYKINSKLKMRIIIWFNLVLKFLYIGINFAGFFLTDFTMDSLFIDYGAAWWEWNKVPNSIAHDIVKTGIPKPGDRFLPSVGICEVHEALNDKRGVYIDKHKVICEVSQNIRYQYIFIILWFFFATGVLISTLGLFHLIYSTLKAMFVVYNPTCYEEELRERISEQLTLREIEYLEKIRLMDMTMYGEVIRELYRYKPGLQTIKRFNESATSDSVSLMPSAPNTARTSRTTLYDSREEFLSD
ncbi:innexin inx3-like [Clytia hemisphaerica]|uniref:Innexin n=1 Tax=Clytia hemisphaerica TaxID=252671 RepID=A0A7M5V897_9CNID